MSSSGAGPTEVLLVRHGRTAMNAQARLSGRHDTDLDETGEVQAAQLGRAVARGVAGPLQIVSSPLVRCVRTAASVAQACGLSEEQVELDPRFLEMDYGDWDGRLLADLPGDVWHRWRSDPDFAPPGGETLRDVSVRVDAAMADWVDRAAGGTLVVCSHVSPIKAAVIGALGVGESVTWRMRLSNASIRRLSCSLDAEGWLVGAMIGFNDVSHLEP